MISDGTKSRWASFCWQLRAASCDDVNGKDSLLDTSKNVGDEEWKAMCTLLVVGRLSEQTAVDWMASFDSMALLSDPFLLLDVLDSSSAEEHPRIPT